ncbi:cytochrome P450 [Xylaria curta]|nr:cytochrome P450 [Xylaria curta]
MAEWLSKRSRVLFLLYSASYLILQGRKWYQESKANNELSRRHNCQLPPELPKRWPLGIDRIKELWDSNAEGKLLAFLCSVAKDYEPRNNLYQFLLVGLRAFHVLHPRNVEAILSTNFKEYGFGCRPAVFAPLIGKGISTQEGPERRHSRNPLRKQFARTQYQNLDHFREHVDNLIASIPTQGQVDLQPLFFNLTLDTTTALLFGRSEATNQEFAECFTIAQEGLAKRFRLAPFHYLYNPPRFRRACRKVHEFVENYVRDRENSRSQNIEDQSTWFLDQIVEGSNNLSEVRDQLLNVLLAGRDTTACSLSWLFRLLVRHPHYMQRLRSEVHAVMGDSPNATREQIRNTPFLACVVKESIRLYPPVPLNNREAVRTTILPTGGGPDGNNPILVRKGELVKNIYGVDADIFRPERWETGELANIGWAYFPFNGGPRQCLGEDFALMEVYYTTVKLLQTFPCIELPPGEPNEPVGTERQRLSLVLASADGCKISTSKAS